MMKLFPEDGLTYMYRSTRIYLFVSALIANIGVIGAGIASFQKNPIWLNVFTGIAALLYTLWFIDICFFLFGRGNIAKKTKEERAKIYNGGYEQGRFDEDLEDLERTYKLGKYAPIYSKNFGDEV
jgi:hypothetical protein